MSKNRRAELLKAYSECYDFNLACNRIMASSAERAEWEADKTLRMEMDSILSGCYSVGISALTGMISAMNDLKFVETEEADGSNPLDKVRVRKPVDMGEWITRYASTQMKAIDQLQELISRQLESTRSQDSVLKVVYEKLDRADMEGDSKVEIVRGDGNLSWDYGKVGSDDSAVGELKSRIEKGAGRGAEL